MFLKDIKKYEYQLLLIEQDVTKIDFNDYLTLESLLDEIGKITSTYIEYLDKYSKCIPEEGAKEFLTKLNEKLLGSEIHIDADKCLKMDELIKKYGE